MTSTFSIVRDGLAYKLVEERNGKQRTLLVTDSATELKRDLDVLGRRK